MDTSTVQNLLTTNEAGKYVGLSGRTLEGRRRDGTGPKFVKYGTGRSARVYYRREDLDAFIESHLRESTQI